MKAAAILTVFSLGELELRKGGSGATLSTLCHLPSPLCEGEGS